MKTTETLNLLIDKISISISDEKNKNNNFLMQELKEVREYLIKLENEQKEAVKSFWSRQR